MILYQIKFNAPNNLEAMEVVNPKVVNNIHRVDNSTLSLKEDNNILSNPKGANSILNHKEVTISNSNTDIRAKVMGKCKEIPIREEDKVATNNQVMVLKVKVDMEVVTNNNRDTDMASSNTVVYMGVNMDNNNTINTVACQDRLANFHFQDRKNYLNMGIVLNHRYMDQPNRRIYQKMYKPVKYLWEV